jgi:EAL domain-containing protein (putative c-di-GMP-specific phosphodiesterase class I)
MSVADGLPAITSVYQPIVDLDTGVTVAYEALVRGAPGSALHTPAELFAWAHLHGRLADFDWACRLSAVGGVITGLPAGAGLFVNVEPTMTDLRSPALLDRMAALAQESGARLVVEVTERRLADDVGGLLRFIDEVRARGWAVAIDDVGAVPASLALMPLLAPEVIKLDLALIQARTTVDTARIVNAVMAQAERTGAVVLAEGIETPAHEELARSMGAQLGQGWRFGRPAALPEVPVARPLRLTPASMSEREHPVSPWDLVSGQPAVRRARKPLLLAMSQHLERQVFAGDDATLLLGALQLSRYFYPHTARRYESLAATAFLVAVFGDGVSPVPARGVRGQALLQGDPLLEEWTVVVITPHFAGALIANDVHDLGEQAERRFDYVVTFDRDIVLAAASSLVRRMQPWEQPRLSGAAQPVTALR